MQARNIVLFVAGLIFFLLLLAALKILPGGSPNLNPQRATLEFWGVGDDAFVWREIIAEFNKAYPFITIKYEIFDRSTYEEKLVNKIAEGAGPDIFILANSQIVKHLNKIYPIPPEFNVTARNFQESFVDGLAESLIRPDGSIIGIPLFVDTLAVFYNKDIFNAEGVAVPPMASWDEVIALSQQFTRKTPFKEITRSGIPLGTYRNVDHAFEIVSTVFFQYNAAIVSFHNLSTNFGTGGINGLDFYTSFANPTKENFSWTKRMPSSLDAFAEGQSAMVFGFSEDMMRLRAKNPHLKYGVAPFPQRKDAPFSVSYGKFFFPTVAKFSREPAAAWQFLLFLGSRPASELYLKKTGRPPARRDLIVAGATTAEMDVFYRQSLIAKTWAIPDEKKTLQLFDEMIDSINLGVDIVSGALSRLDSQLQLLLQ